MTNLVGKKVLIAGAAGMLGQSIAEEIAAHGGQLILLDINQPRLDALSERLKKQGRDVRAYLCDLEDRRCIYATAEKILSDSRVDVLISTAGFVAGRFFGS